MAPEQAMNTRRADHRADIYSLGCTLWFLLTGQPVFGGDTVMERLVAHREHPVPSLKKACPAAPPWLDGVFRKMVAKKPDDRYQSVTALVSDLARRSAPRKKQVAQGRGCHCGTPAARRDRVPFPRQDIAGRPERPTGEKNSTTNSEANLVAGKRLCFVENKWAEGLPLLAQCSDAELKTAGDGGTEGKCRIASGTVETWRPLVGLCRK